MFNGDFDWEITGVMQAGQQTSSLVALATVAMVTSLLWRHRQQCGAESWSLSVSLRDFIGTWTLQIDRPTDRLLSPSSSS